MTRIKNVCLLLSLALMPVFACDCTPPIVPDVDLGPGDGTITIDGADQQYAVNLDDSELLILVRNKVDQFGCGLFHSHIVESKGFVSNFDIDLADPSSSSFSAVVPAAGLVPDAPELRARFPETADQELGEGDRASIRVSVLENVRADEFPTLTFSARELTAVDGDGEASLDVNINGANSTITFSYTASEADGVFTINGEGTLDGVPHGLPSGFASDCIETEMDLFLKLVLEPGAANIGTDAGVIETFVPTEFPYVDGCSDVVAFEDVREILGPRCMGCHLDPTRLGATATLVDFDDYRFDTARAIGRPLFETLGEYIQLPDAESLHMPPLDVTQLASDERDTLLAWVAAGAPDVRCAPNPFPPFVHVDQAPCGTLIYDDIAPFVDQQCGFCHTPTQTALPLLDTFEVGLNISGHPFYQPLNVWEASAVRLQDDSMPPELFAFDEDPQIPLFLDWVAQGYPTTRCDIPDAGPTADAGEPVDGG